MPNRVIDLILTHPDELEVEFDAFPKWLQILLPAKGYIISEVNCSVLNFPLRISALKWGNILFIPNLLPLFRGYGRNSLKKFRVFFF